MRAATRPEHRPSSRSWLRRTVPVAAVAAALFASAVAPADAGNPHEAQASHAAPASHGAAPSHGWVATWGTSPSGKVDNGCASCTIRDVVHTSVGGKTVRVHLSNVFGTAPLVVDEATVALPSTPGTAQVQPGTMRPLEFRGTQRVTIPAGRAVVSDPVRLEVPADHDLLVSTYTPGYSTPMTFHPGAQQDSFFTSGTNATEATSAAALPQKTQAWHFVTGVDVTGSHARGTVVAFGDSITDGYQSTYNVDHRWPNFLAGRLNATHHPLGVVDAGIGGNRVLLDGGDGFGPAAVSRFQRDVLDQTDVRTVIVLLGINDIQQEPHQLDPAKITAGLSRMAAMAHARGIRVLGGTLTPFEGWSTYDASEEAARQGVNDWIRRTRAYDGYVDFDAAVRDPADPHRMLAVYDSGDHLHPNDIGYAAMGDAIDLGAL
ncbi:SGNH/GDSL hydrolase family protein [Cellulomonas sp. PhB143]|uniref:SGNH/GDSL hydrolase family protein n=1 Tax=Cellulomonas sp. PhB143 TaxID=2485186 RepID=UPI000FACA71F|nr:SGNH/GDSL hydrolase family protein [Cellulomonas sp. PhB143]ROS78695.1 lysophospholipase L1-like esterase [Cellulomonas sp. PhB143]